ncbi:MAG: ATP-binding cassette domain-containing protein, partial [Puniceicoccales bacterium]|nr:ATP-binding cassette domain-containing protein [Puniceicoccales bacterium]
AREKWTMALVFQSGALFNSMDVFDNLALYPREHRLGQEKEIGSRVETILDMLSLGEAAHKMPSELSGGMRKRVAIARGLIMNPHLFLYDEPTSELDPVTGASVIEIIALVNRKFKTTTVVVSHDSKLAFSIGTHVTFLHDGRLAQVTVPSNSSLSSDPVMGEFLNPTIDPENPRFKKSSPPL